eukprot:79092-Rhodomonas_salina.3
MPLYVGAPKSPPAVPVGVYRRVVGGIIDGYGPTPADRPAARSIIALAVPTEHYGAMVLGRSTIARAVLTEHCGACSYGIAT